MKLRFVGLNSFRMRNFGVALIVRYTVIRSGSKLALDAE